MAKKRSLKQQKYEELLKEYEAKAKLADQRLIRIEKAGKTRSSYAYKEAQADILMMGGTKSSAGRKRIDRLDVAKGHNPPVHSGVRFSQKRLKSETNIKRALTRVNRFLEMPTSKLSGITAADTKRMNTFETKYGIKFENGDMIAKFFDSGVMDRMAAKNRFDSKTVLKVIGKLAGNISDIQKAIHEADEKVEYYRPGGIKEIVQEAYKKHQGGDLAPMDMFEIDDSIIDDLRIIFS